MKKKKKADKIEDVVPIDKKVEREFTDWLSVVIPKIMRIYGLGNITCYYQTVGEKLIMDSGEVAFEMNYQKMYKSAYLTIFPLAVRFWKEKQISFLRNSITHEVAHIFTSHISEIAEQRYIQKREIAEANEELTEAIAQMGRKLVDKAEPDLFKLDKGRDAQKIIKRVAHKA